MNCAIVGLGKIGIMHAAMVRNIPGARLAALIDRQAKLGRYVQSMMGTPVPFFTRIEDALRQVPLQAAFVCTPQCAHRPVAERCLEAGLDVFVEKPLAHGLEDAAAMIASLRRHPGAVAAVGFMKAHEGLYQEVGRLLREGSLGALRGFEATCYLSQVFKPRKGWIYSRNLSGGGMVMNSTCHLLQALLRWFGPVRSVLARCCSVHSAEVEDEAAIELEFGGLRGRVKTSWSRPGYEVETSTICIEGSAATLAVDDSGLRLREHGENRVASFCRSPEGAPLRAQRAAWSPAAPVSPPCSALREPRFWPRGAFEQATFNLSPSYGGEGYYREDEDFVQACLERRPAKVGWEEGFAVQRLIDAVYRSQGRRIEL